MKEAPVFSLQYIEEQEPVSMEELKASGLGTVIDSWGEQGEKIDHSRDPLEV